MSRKCRSRWLVSASLALCAAFAAGQDRQALDRQFQSAVANYDTEHYTEAAAQLEALLPYGSKSFEVHELLGLIYAAQSQDSKAVDQLEIAAHLKPDSAAARTNLAASLFHAGKSVQAEEQFRKALELDPQDYDANHNLGELYVQSRNMTEAIPLLEKAQKIRPSYDNGYDLALAYFLTGKLDQARQLVQNLELIKDTGELHNLRAQIEEKDGKYLAAVNEYETAAHMDPSENNLFDWGSELLLHRTYEPAIEVFQQATQRYSKSPRLFIGLGMALYSRGKYDDAVKALLTAADLNPSDPRCYLFLSKAYGASPNETDDVIRRFRRYADLEPNNAQAVYYYAMSLWKGKRVEDPGQDLQDVESLLEKSITLDPNLADAYVQLGNFYADKREYAKSVPEYESALKLNPNLADAHYRLGQDYVHTGEKDRAQAEFEVYQRLRAEQLAEVDKERAEVQQFVYSEKEASSSTKQ
ncbi:tetratricopeptide repeat protein [Alloacidobacterium sp.]|uniref:tetratricopeptide repeat protein n=1 Tax=Alloacidobacterium sp. TaxID=2951999 RepID=UPI002D2282E3|nr:tetratricopeptide repeat protein [Alloacidobacterium sp.]HYK36614.1 tetratricopeptide repeat protein [Alloacidobacterium sp.]